MFLAIWILPSTSNLNGPCVASLSAVITAGLAGKVVPNPTLDTLPPTSGTIKSPRTETPIPVVWNFLPVIPSPRQKSVAPPYASNLAILSLPETPGVSFSIVTLLLVWILRSPVPISLI